MNSRFDIEPTSFCESFFCLFEGLDLLESVLSEGIRNEARRNAGADSKRTIPNGQTAFSGELLSSQFAWPQRRGG